MRKHYLNMLKIWAFCDMDYVIDDAWIRALECTEAHLDLYLGKGVVEAMNIEVSEMTND